MPVRYDFAETRWSDPGTTPTISDADKLIVRNGIWSIDAPRGAFQSRVEVKKDFSSYKDPYFTGTNLVAETAVRAIGALHSVRRCRVSYTAPTGTTIQMRIRTSGSDQYWSGAAWVAAGATDWNTPAEIEANISSWTPASVPLARTIGFVFNLIASSSATPVVYGIDCHFRLLFQRNPSNSHIGDSWIDDAIYRTLIHEMATSTAMSAWSTHIVDSVDQGGGNFSVIDYSDGVDERVYNVTNVGDVYDITNDSTLTTPLAGTWSSVAKTFTLTTPIAFGPSLLVNFEYQPQTVYGGDGDYEVDNLPLLAIENVRSSRRERWSDRSVITDSALTSSWSIRAPETFDLLFEVAAFAESPTEAMATAEAFCEWAQSTGRLVSPGTGIGIDIQVDATDLSITRRGDFWQVLVGAQLMNVVRFYEAEQQYNAAQTFEFNTEATKEVG